MKVSTYIIHELEKVTDHVFCVVGGMAMHLNDSLYDSKLTPVFMLHEQGAAFAAQAYGHLTNKLGVCMTTAGPGATNAITGCLAAWMDSTPVLFISGQVQTKYIHHDGRRYIGPQECDIISMTTAITKYNETITDSKEVKTMLAGAIIEATTGRKGPVWLDIPLDIQGEEIDD